MSATAEDPYQIANAQDLIELGKTTDDYDKSFVLVSDIDLSGHAGQIHMHAHSQELECVLVI